MTKLNPNLYMLPIEIGTILYQKTSDEIQMSLEGDIQAINEHEEPWVVEDINVSRETLNFIIYKQEEFTKCILKN